jgi:hypothetical protein
VWDVKALMLQATHTALLRIKCAICNNICFLECTMHVCTVHAGGTAALLSFSYSRLHNSKGIDGNG